MSTPLPKLPYVQNACLPQSVQPLCIPLTPPLSKTFINDSRDEYISIVLKQNGWKQVPKNSAVWTLKWTWKGRDREIDTLGSGRFINHFRGTDEFTTKIGLALLYRKTPIILQSGKSSTTFYPRSYNLSTQKEQFRKDFIHTSILTLLKKIIVHVEVYHQSLFEQISQYKSRKMMRIQQSGQFLKEIFTARKIVGRSDKQAGFWVDGKYFLRLLFYLENIFSLDQQYNFHESQLTQLSQYSISPTFTLETNPNSLISPSTQSLALALLYYQACHKEVPGFQQDGFSSIWVIKSNHSSRGRNIELIDKLTDIDFYDNGMKLVQKYIENIWVLGDSEHEGGLEAYTKLRKLVGKKFDIRFWVLVKSFTPLEAYIYDDAYLRVSSMNYRLDSLKQKNSHLTNYSINWKTSKKDSQEDLSYVLFSDFIQYLKQIQKHDTQKLIKTIHKIILQTLKLIDIKQDPRCFQLFGFDIILDAQLNPWILECNMSPACEPRGQLTSLLQNMTIGMLTVLGFIDSSITGWKLLTDGSFNRKTMEKSMRKSESLKNQQHILKSLIFNWSDQYLTTKKLDCKWYQNIQSRHSYKQTLLASENQTKASDEKEQNKNNFTNKTSRIKKIKGVLKRNQFIDSKYKALNAKLI